MRKEFVKISLGLAVAAGIPTVAICQTDGGVVGAAGNAEQGVTGPTGSKASTIEAIASGAAPGASATTTATMFRRLDRNKDGVLSRREFQSGYDAVIVRDTTGPATTTRRVIRSSR